MLIDPTAHEPLQGANWDDALARAAIQDIVDDALQARRPDGRWPMHPLDGDGQGVGLTVYLGAAGVLHALSHLARAGAARVGLDLADAIARVERDYEGAPDTGEPVPGYFLGRSGVLLARHAIATAPGVRDRLHAVLVANRRNPTWELLWGTPGTMLVALQLHRSSGEERFRDVYLRDVGDLLEAWAPVDPPGCHLWTQDLYGKVRRFVGTGHGQTGNLQALLAGRELLPGELLATIVDRAVKLLERTAVEEGGQRNWPALVGEGTCDRVQWCHGAPGVVTALAPLPAGVDARLDAMLLEAGELVWQAGPLAKGPGLCHGTAGNGYAFLALHRRQGGALWLERARAFAMHAIVQCRRQREIHGARRYSLWTGDMGLAVYLWHCINGGGGMLGLDVI